MFMESFRKVLFGNKHGIKDGKSNFVPDNRATRRRRGRFDRKSEPKQAKVYHVDAKYPLAGYKSPHKPREVASRKPVKR